MKQTTTKTTESTYLRGIREKRDETRARLARNTKELPSAQAEHAAAKDALGAFDEEHRNYLGTGVLEQRYGLSVALGQAQQRVSELESTIREDEAALRQLSRMLEASGDCVRLAAGLRENRERRQTVADHRDRAVAVRDGEAAEAQAKIEKRDALRKAQGNAIVEAKMRGEKAAPNKELVELETAIVEHESARDAASEMVAADDAELKALDDTHNELGANLRGAQIARAEITFRDAMDAAGPAIAEYQAALRRSGAHRDPTLPLPGRNLVEAAMVRLQAEEQPLRAAVHATADASASDEPAAA